MNSMLFALAQATEEYPSSGGGGGMIGALFGGVFFLIWLVVVVIVVAGLWKVFEKAGEPGWAAIVPIYNIVTLVKISGKEMWWVILFFLPCANIVAAVMVSMEIAKKFGQGTGFGLGLAFLPFIFYPMLGFGSAQYSRSA